MKKGDIIQIIDQKDNWYPCLLIVDEVKSWGVQAYILIPNNDGRDPGIAYYRISNGKFESVGVALIETSI